MSKHPFTFTPEKFLARLTRSGDCLVWTGGCDRDGYGRLSRVGRRMGAHQVAYELAFGPIPDGLCVLHRCDNPPCCEPSHLFLGSVADNNADKLAKGRQTRGEVLAAPRRGERNNLSRLTAEAVRIIRSSPETHADLARRFGVAPHTIHAVRSGRTWRHVA